MSARELQFFKNRNDAIVVEISGNFLLKISKQIMHISLLNALRCVKHNAVTKFPKTSLGDKAAPDVRYAEANETRQIQSKEMLSETTRYFDC